MIRLRLDTRVGAEMNALYAIDNLRQAMAQTYFVKDENDENMLFNNRDRLVKRFSNLLRTKGDIGETEEVLTVNIFTGSNEGTLIIFDSELNRWREEEFVLMNKEQHRAHVDKMLKEMKHLLG